jgi:ribosomal protein S12 methylthiotransferase accessory factor
LAPHLTRIGVVRVSELTHLDRIGIPVFSAVAPRPNDTISVYHGKGIDRESAKVSAVMEAMERWAAGLPCRPVAVASHDEMVTGDVPALDPQALSVATAAGYRSDRNLSWLSSWNLVDDSEVLVPHAAATYQRTSHEPPLLQFITTLGIASGNTLEEAICHALCEVIERDAITTFETTLSCERAAGRPLRSPVELDLSTVPPSAAALVDRFLSAGLLVEALYATSDLKIPVFAVKAYEGTDALVEHRGYGASPDAETALIRALTECAQSRAGDIEGLREDSQLGDWVIRPPGEALVPRDPGAQPRILTERVDLLDFTRVPTYATPDLVTDIHLMTDALNDVGLRRVLITDLSPPGLPFHVVRAIVPGAETWFFDRSKLGARALAAWNRCATALEASEHDDTST